MYFLVAELDSKVTGTFKATCCTAPRIDQSQVDYWNSLAFGDMFKFCEKVQGGTASKVHKLSCCGSENCMVSTCTLQTSWSMSKGIT